MQVLVIGANGQLGTAICDVFDDVHVLRADLDGENHLVDISQEEQVFRLILDELKPDLVINAAAAHSLPQCEKHPAHSFAVNASGPGFLATACKHAGARLVHISTDYVFGDGATRPYVEEDLPAPLSVYGASKLAGEHLVAAHCRDHVIIRTAALYGPAPCRAKGGLNFVDTMLRQAEEGAEVRVVDDEITTPTLTLALARQVRVLAEKAEPGVYHATCQGECSWHAFAEAIFEEAGVEANLIRVSCKQFQLPVRRPSYSVLDNVHARAQGLDEMPPWRDALRTFLVK